MLGRVATVGASSSAARMNATTLSRLRSAATSSERRHKFSTLQAIPQHFLLHHQQPHIATGLPSREDDDDDAQNKSHRSNNILRHSSAKINWNNNNTALPTTMMQHNTNNNNLTIL
eukprot:scaffold22585_cov111-Skeletonema_dohrnii-CCMP3373.AAC.1